MKKSAEGSDEELHDGGVEVRLEDLRPELRDRGLWSSISQLDAPGLLPVAGARPAERAYEMRLEPGRRPNDYQPLASDAWGPEKWRDACVRTAEYR